MPGALMTKDTSVGLAGDVSLRRHWNQADPLDHAPADHEDAATDYAQP